MLQEDLPQNYALFLRSMSVCLLQMESLLVQGCAFRDGNYEQRQEEVNRIVEQIEDGRKYFDWQAVLSEVKSELMQWYAKKCEVKNAFELNRETVTIAGNIHTCREGYYLFRILDALPLVSNHVTLMSSLELPWIRALLELNPQVGVFMLIRGSTQENCKKLINRRFLAELPQEMINAEIRFLIHAIESNLEELADNVPTVSVKAYFLRTGLMNLLGKEEGCQLTMGKFVTLMKCTQQYRTWKRTFAKSVKWSRSLGMHWSTGRC